jgi:nucleoid DNA-binding protein
MASKAKKPKAMTKAQMAGELAAKTGLTKVQIGEVFAAQAELVAAELKGGRPIAIPGLVKITLQHKAATPAKPGRNPATGEAIMIKAKPARRVVRVRALKALKDMAS